MNMMNSRKDVMALELRAAIWLTYINNFQVEQDWFFRHWQEEKSGFILRFV